MTHFLKRGLLLLWVTSVPVLAHEPAPPTPAPLAGTAAASARNARWAVPVQIDGVPNLHRITDHLYRSEQPTADGFRNLEKLGIRTVINLRYFNSDDDEAAGTSLQLHRVKILTYMLLGLCVGIATMLYVPRLGSASPTTGLLWELEAIAAVIVGGTALKGGAGSITGTVVGAVLLSVISNILNLTSIISVYLNAAVQGFVIIVVAFLQRGKR